MKLIDKLLPEKIKHDIITVVKILLKDENFILFTGIMIQSLLILSIFYIKESIVFPLFIAVSLFYLLSAKIVKKQTKDVILLILVFGFTFRFTVSLSTFWLDAPSAQLSMLNLKVSEYRVFKDLSNFFSVNIVEKVFIKGVIFLFEFLLIRVLLHIYRMRKHFFIHYFWNIPIIYEFYFRSNLIVIFLLLFFLSLYLAITWRRFLSAITLALSFFFNFGVFPFFAFFYKKIKWWLILTFFLCVALIFIAGYYKILFSYMTTFQEIERGFFSFLTFLKLLIPYSQVVLLLYYTFIITIVIYLIIKEIYIFDSIYFFLLTLLLINPNKDLGFISFLLCFTVIFPNMGVVYFSLLLFIKSFLAEAFFSDIYIKILNIIAVLTLYFYHAKIFFKRLTHFYKKSLKDRGKIS